MGARADGWVETTTRAAIDSRAPPTVVLALTAGLAIAGRVVDAAGQPVASAKIAELGDVPAVAAATGRKSAVTDSGGAFRIEGLAEGTYDLRVAPAGATSVFSLDDVTTITTCSNSGRPPQPDGEDRPAGPACTPFYVLDVAAGTRGLEITVPAPGAIDAHASLAVPPPFHGHELRIRLPRYRPGRPGPSPRPLPGVGTLWGRPAPPRAGERRRPRRGAERRDRLRDAHVRTEEALKTLLETKLDARQRAAAEAVCIDMHRPYMRFGSLRGLLFTDAVDRGRELEGG